MAGNAATRLAAIFIFVWSPKVRRVLFHCAYSAMPSSYRLDGGWRGYERLFTDEEAARYLCGGRHVAQLVQALQAARTRRPEATFDERVTEVWASMRGRIQVTFDDDKT